MHTHVHTHQNKHTDAHTHTCTHNTYTMYMHTCMYIRIHTPYTYTAGHILHIHTWYVHTCRVHVHTCVYMSNTCIHIHCVYMYMCMHHVWFCEHVHEYLLHCRLCGLSISWQPMKVTWELLPTPHSALSGVSLFHTSLWWSPCLTCVGYANRIVWQSWGLRTLQNQPNHK